MKSIIYTPAPLPRLDYVADYVLKTLLGLEMVVTTSEDVFRHFEGIRINYAASHITDHEVHICPQGLLADIDVREQPLGTFFTDGAPAIMGVAPGYDLPFDPFAASFFILTRYEEYLPYTADEHDRFPATQSWAWRSGCLAQPILWNWAMSLARAIQRHYPTWTHRPPGYRFLPTYDVDIPWAYLHRGLRGWARAGLDLLKGDLEQVRQRVAVRWGYAHDPFDTFAALARLHRESDTRPRVFWLLADAGRQDVNPSHQLPAYRELIREVSTWSDGGIHPGYHAHLDTTLIGRHKSRLEAILDAPIEHSRQHFLRMRLPATYRALLAAGIRHDYTMGFAEAVGYRAGTTEPFRWYDLAADQVTDLWVHPFAAMDVTLKQYMQLSPTAAAASLAPLQAHSQREELAFSTLWHNSSFSDAHGWGNWWEVYVGLFSK